MDRKLKVLFLCTGNSCRSQMAEGWARALKGSRIEPYSAGIKTHGLNPNAILRTTVLTTTGGAYTFVVAPGILTTYQATWKGAYATPTTIQVQPKLTLGRNGAWVIHAYGGHGLAGRDVQFQRLNTLTGQWVTLRKVQLNARSGARLSLTLPKGLNHLRLAMSVNEAGAGLLGAVGTPITWRQT